MPAPVPSVRFCKPDAIPGVELVSVVYRERSFPPHSHPEYVIGAIVAGAETLDVGRDSHVAPAGASLLLNPEQTHANASIPPSALAYRVLYVSIATMAEWLDRQPAFARPVDTSPILFRKVVAAHRSLELSVDRLAQEAAFAALLGELWLCEGLDGGRGAPSARSIGIDRAKDYIDASFTSDFGLGDISEIAGLSRYHFIRAFKRATGLTPVAYRNQRRIEAARKLLRTGRPIAEIALDVGFADQSHLTRQFQRLVGTSPGRYRGNNVQALTAGRL